ncbi:unnamed protein product [Closterium sp. NIES-53]
MLDTVLLLALKNFSSWQDSLARPLAHSFASSDQAFARVGLDPTSLGTHSFRKTAATLAADAGVPDRLFKALGRWRSDCAKEMYITQLNSELIRASRLMQDPTRLSSTIRYAATVNRVRHRPLP